MDRLGFTMILACGLILFLAGYILGLGKQDLTLIMNRDITYTRDK
jgi:maltodextrin utilization protein YvdJ